ncbi:MAG: CDP-alcohol phosphatidyltransferase family protein [Chloroflexota bacterium]
MSATKPPGAGSLVSPETRARVRKLGEPVALLLGRLGFTPNGLTLIGFAITVVGGILLALQVWLLGGLVVFVGGVFDLFDGTLARATGRVGRLGAFMDSVFDRWGEAIVYLGIAWGGVLAGADTVAVLAAAAMGAAFMVSYTRAKSEGLGFTAGSRMAAVGVMPREVRLVILSVSLVVAGLLGMSPAQIAPCGNLFCVEGLWRSGAGVLELALAIIAVGATITVIQRIIHVMQQAVPSDGK